MIFKPCRKKRIKIKRSLGLGRETSYRGFGLGGGLGTPVVSYAPRPMLAIVFSLLIIFFWETDRVIFRPRCATTWEGRRHTQEGRLMRKRIGEVLERRCKVELGWFGRIAADLQAKSRPREVIIRVAGRLL